MDLSKGIAIDWLLLVVVVGWLLYGIIYAEFVYILIPTLVITALAASGDING